MSNASAASVPGRPRDPGVDERVAEAAISVFGEVGWSGFSVEAVARRAGVGKASIYLRWPSKEALLASALETRMADIEAIDTGSTRGDLVELTRQLLRLYLSDSGHATMRLTLDGDKVPKIRERYEALTRSQILAARAIVRRGIRRGELAQSTSVTVLLDALCGGAMMHAMSTPAELRGKVTAGAETYAQQLVDFVLGSASAAGRGEPPTH
jgi:AcrR family transcriptional regulator